MTEQTVSEVRQPKLQTYCALLYERFLTEHTVEVVDEIECKIWRGKLVATALDIGIPDGVYKRVTNQLENLNCIEQLERGVRGAPSVYVLLRPPTADVWQDEIRGKGLTGRYAPAILDRRISDIERRLPNNFDVVKALGELQQQIDELKFVLDKTQ